MVDVKAYLPFLIILILVVIIGVGGFTAYDYKSDLKQQDSTIDSLNAILLDNSNLIEELEEEAQESRQRQRYYRSQLNELKAERDEATNYNFVSIDSLVISIASELSSD